MVLLWSYSSLNVVFFGHPNNFVIGTCGHFQLSLFLLTCIKLYISRDFLLLSNYSLQSFLYQSQITGNVLFEMWK